MLMLGLLIFAVAIGLSYFLSNAAQDDTVRTIVSGEPQRVLGLLC